MQVSPDKPPEVPRELLGVFAKDGYKRFLTPARADYAHWFSYAFARLCTIGKNEEALTTHLKTHVALIEEHPDPRVREAALEKLLGVVAQIRTRVRPATRKSLNRTLVGGIQALVGGVLSEAPSIKNLKPAEKTVFVERVSSALAYASMRSASLDLFHKFERNLPTLLSASSPLTVAKEINAVLKMLNEPELPKNIADILVARRYQKARRRREKPDLLSAMIRDPNVRTLDSARFSRWLTRDRVAPEIETRMTLPQPLLVAQETNQLMTDLFAERLMNRTTDMPVFLSTGRPGGQLPEMGLRSLEELRSKAGEYELRDGAYYTKEAYRQLQRVGSYTPIFRNEVDKLVQQFSKLAIIPWGFTEEACYSRAEIVCQVLKAMGVPADRISKQYIYAPDLSYPIDPRISKRKWDFHVAAAIQLSNGTRWIIDPSIDPQQGLTLQDWIKKFKRDQSPTGEPYRSFPGMAYDQWGENPDEKDVFILHVRAEYSVTSVDPGVYVADVSQRKRIWMNAMLQQARGGALLQSLTPHPHLKQLVKDYYVSQKVDKQEELFKKIEDAISDPDWFKDPADQAKIIALTETLRASDLSYILVRSELTKTRLSETLVKLQTLLSVRVDDPAYVQNRSLIVELQRVINQKLQKLKDMPS